MTKLTMCDTSSAVEMSERGILPEDRLYTTHGTYHEMENFHSSRRLKERVWKAVDFVPYAKCDNVLQLKEDAIRAYLSACSEKKQRFDPISQEDLAFITAVIGQAEAGRHVKVFSEDSHIYKTLEHMLGNGYKKFSNQIEIVRIRNS